MTQNRKRRDDIDVTLSRYVRYTFISNTKKHKVDKVLVTVDCIVHYSERKPVDTHGHYDD